MDKYVIKPLERTDLRQMHRSFTEAFSDYPVPMQLGYSSFKERMLNKLGIHFDLSVGAFSGEKLVAFIFHTINHYKGTETVYNGGTGVIPGHRGHGLTMELYKSFCRAGQTGATRCVLEVITINRPAIRVYEQAGFRKTDYYRCYKLVNPATLSRRASDNTEIRQGTLGKADVYAAFDSVQSSFSDTFQQLLRSQKPETALEAYVDNVLVGYLIYQPVSGRISRMAVDVNYRRRGVGSQLLSRAFTLGGRKVLSVINVPESSTDVHSFLLHSGFKNEIDQWEMELSL